MCLNEKKVTLSIKLDGLKGSDLVGDTKNL